MQQLRKQIADWGKVGKEAREELQEKIQTLESKVGGEIQKPCPNYLKQFVAAAKLNCWTPKKRAVALTVALREETMNVLHTLPEKEMDNYEETENALTTYEFRAGIPDADKKPTTESQRKEFEADVARLVRFAFRSVAEPVIECLAIQAFIDGVPDDET